MPPGFGHVAPPLEFFIVEAIYVLFVAILSLVIYFKTKELYDLSKHKGIYYFRNIFLFFSLSYIFRSIQMIFPISKELFSIMFPIYLMRLNMIIVSYFSTMAILSLIMAIHVKDMKSDVKKIDFGLHILAIASSLIVFIIKSALVLLTFQLILFAVTLIILIMNAKNKHGKLVTQNTLTYVLLFLFWCINVILLARGVVERELHIPLNILSASVYLWVFLRVTKRLKGGKKKGQA